MQMRHLGRSGPLVSALGLGCMGMSNAYGAADESESVATVREALDAGANFLDTADMYGLGHNEELLSRALADGYRAKAFVATKFGNTRRPDGTPTVDGRPDYVREAVEKSLSRLKIDVIDLYYQHRVDPNVPIEDTVGAMARLVEQGKVRHLGLSEASAATVRRAAAVHPIAALQTEYSIWCRFVEADILPTCRELGVSLVAYSPLGRGMLTGAFKTVADLKEGDRRRDHPRFAEGALESNAKLIAPMLALAAQKGATPAQAALAWVLAQGPDVLAIPGASKRAHLRDNLAGAELALSLAEARALADAIDDSHVSGTRYPAAQMRAVNI